MGNKLIFISLMILLQVCNFGFSSDANATGTSLVSFSSGAFLVKQWPGYDSQWDNIWIMDENPKTGWCCPKGEILNNVCVVELAEKSVIERVEFDTGSIDGAGRGAKDIAIELSNDGPSEGFTEILSASLADKKDNQSFPVTVDASGKWLRLTVKNNHGSSDYTELMDFRAYGKQLTKTKLPDISGTYKTNYHDFHIRQQGTSVTGCYEYEQGLFNGGIEDNIMRLTWRETNSLGPAVMIFNSKGDAFFGLWWYEGKENERGRIWNGQKTADEVGSCPHWAGDVQGQITRELLDAGRVRLYGVNFDVDSDVIRDESKPTLDKIVAILQSERAMQLIIEGHTDSEGETQHNQILSQKRAESVKAYLVTEGISSSRLSTEGYGESKPVAPNTTATGRAQNRRVELVARK
jgi:outer membrane protein OmpA-like peptidoglycan-associated protein